MEPFQQYLDPATLARIRDLELKARRTIEGLVSGAHRSPLQGVSVEFAEHREYVPGDDVRHIDWKVFAKTERFYLKRYEQETNLICHIVVDASQSMNYSSGGKTKLDYACELAAVLSYMVLRQQDSVGMTLFEDRIRYHVQASSQATQLKHLLHLLAVCKPSNYASKIGEVLDELGERLKKRCLILVITDGFSDAEALERGLRHLGYKRHEIVFFQILDGEELDFTFRNMTMFRGLENMPEALVEPSSIRDAYLESFSAFLRQLGGACRAANAEYQQIRTDRPLDGVLLQYLAGRKMRSKFTRQRA